MINMEIGQKTLNSTSPCYIIAEMSANHCGSIDTALAIIQSAKECGANAVKLQTYRADTITLDSDKKDFLLPSDNPWETHKTLYTLYEKAFTPWEWHEQLMQEGEKIGLDVFSSPFDCSAVDFLEELNVPAYKIASPEITDIPMIKKIGATQKPVILSTGVATLNDIAFAIKILEGQGCPSIALLKCTTAYPAPPEEINLRTIPHMAETFNCLVGISDHTLGVGVPIAAVTLGAKMIEKHFILERDESSVDSFFSLIPEEFKLMVNEVRKVEKALGKVSYDLTPEAQKNMWVRRSLYISKTIKKGDKLNSDNVKSVRPGFGLHPKHLDEVLGKKINKDLEKGDRLSWSVIEQ